MSKQCDNCTKCCEGWLPGIVKGHDFYPGKQCFFLNIDVGCSIYKDRPRSPCKSFNCFWIQNIDIPNEFKPNNINVIQIEKTLFFLNNDKIKNPFLEWVFVFCTKFFVSIFFIVCPVI